MTESVAHWSQWCDRLAPSLPGASIPWVSGARAEARERLGRVGLPGGTPEDWKYTSVAPILKARLDAGSDDATPDGAASAVARLALPDPARLLVFVDGRYAAALSRVGSLPAGASLQPLAGLLASGDDAARAAFADDAEAADGFVALGRASARDGAVLELGPGVTVDEPIHVLYYSTGVGRVVSCLNLIRAAARSRATVIEHVAGAPGVRLTTSVTRIDLGEGADIQHHKVQDEAREAFHVACIVARQAGSSRLGTHSYAFGAALSRTTIRTELAGRSCHAELNGLYLLDGRQHADHHTTIDHAEPDGESREFYKGIVDGRARGVFNGRVLVRRDAQRTDARQTNRNLLLSEHAEVDTKPQLEIYADDVKCSHGATIGQLDEAQLFYLRARGVGAEAARSLLTYGFAEDLIARVACTPLRSRLEELLLSRLPQGDRIRELL
jgi:Fe-S cluster assembly protein SufD